MPFVYVASSEKGIAVCQLNIETGELSIVETVDTVPHCQFVALHPSKPMLYAVGTEAQESQLYAFDIADGKLTLCNTEAIGGLDPCYIAIDGSEQYVLVANYGGGDGRGSAVIVPLQPDGQLKPRSDLIQYDGSSVNPNRQRESHPHMIAATPDNRYVLVSDLGTDKVRVSKLENGKLSAHSPDSIASATGSGPRHFAFHPTQPYLYIINELNSTLSAFGYDAYSGIWHDITTISTLADKSELKEYPVDPASDSIQPKLKTGLLMKAVNYPADLHMHPSGQFLYGTNRGANNIVIYKIDNASGKVELIGHQSTLGDWPRGMAIDPSGQIIVVGNQWSSSVLTLRIDTQRGLLTSTGHRVEIPSAVCVQIG
ncbi:MAG: lactonase family protein [Anaerolineae bacterium]|nr:lactonase family protein [Anaerolineae bacterium]